MNYFNMALSQRKRGMVRIFALSLVSFSALSDEVMQGPFVLTEHSSVLIRSSHDNNYPVELVGDVGGKFISIDRYETEGAPPVVESVFYKKINGTENIIVLISWSQVHREEGINGKTYQVYRYSYDNGIFKSNSCITKDPELNGLDGEFDGKTESFKYKNAASIKNYLKNKSSCMTNH